MPDKKDAPGDLRSQIARLGPPPRKVLGVQVPPPAVPPDAIPRAVHPQRAPTLTGVAPPHQPPPQEPPRRESPSPESTGRVLVENPYDPPTITRRARAELERQGDQLEPAPTSTYTPSSGFEGPLPWYKTAKGMVIVLPLLVGSLGGITTTVVIPVIKAVRAIGLAQDWTLVQKDESDRVKIALFGTHPMSGAGEFVEILYSGRTGLRRLTEVPVDGTGDGEVCAEVVHPAGPFRIQVEANEGLVPVK